MTAAHRVSQRGSFRIDRRFRGIGRIAMASGTRSRKTFERYDGMLTELFEDGRVDVLIALKERRLTLQEVYQAKRAERLGYIAAEVLLFRPLFEAVEVWLPDSAPAANSRKRYKGSWTVLRRQALRHRQLTTESLVRDLRGVDWKLLLKQWPNGGSDWNRMRAAVSRFMSVLLDDKWHPFRRDVMKRIPKARESKGRVPDITPVVFWRLVDAVPEHIRAPLVVLAGTGLRVDSEYIALDPNKHLLYNTRRIIVPGTKTENSADVISCGPELWEWVLAGVPSPVKYQQMYRHFKRAAAAIGQPELVIHDLRHLKGQILSDEGLPLTKIASALRNTEDMAKRYVRSRDLNEAAEATDRALFRKEQEA